MAVAILVCRRNFVETVGTALNLAEGPWLWRERSRQLWDSLTVLTVLYLMCGVPSGGDRQL